MLQHQGCQLSLPNFISFIPINLDRHPQAGSNENTIWLLLLSDISSISNSSNANAAQVLQFYEKTMNIYNDDGPIIYANTNKYAATDCSVIWRH